MLGHALVAAADSRDFGELVRSQVCEPLGMADTVLLPDREQAEREAVGHRRRRRTTGHWEVAGLPGAGALRSTATDLLTFLQAQLRPDDTPLGPAIAFTHHQRRPGKRLGIGLGWLRVPRRGGDVLLWHNGGTGGFRAFAGFMPAIGIGALALANDQRNVDRAGFDLLTALSSEPRLFHRGDHLSSRLNRCRTAPMTAMLNPLRPAFLLFNYWFAASLIRVGEGPLLTTPAAGSILVLRTTGRKTGLVREIPLGDAVIGGEVVVIAGFGRGGSGASVSTMRVARSSVRLTPVTALSAAAARRQSRHPHRR